MKVDDEVLAVLSRAQTNADALTLVGQLDRKMYEKANKVIEAAGGKWDKKAKAHLFAGGAAEAMEQILMTGEVDFAKSPKSVAQEYGFFPTPAAVVARLLEIAEIDAGMLVLEPSAGKGAIAYACAKQGATVDCCELLPANFVQLEGDSKLGAVENIDFLTKFPTATYDRVVMNPPFAKQADIHHVNHALKFLKPGGLLVSVMSSGVTFRDSALTQSFRDLIRARGGDIEAVADGAFKESGTMVRTVIVTIPASS